MGSELWTATQEVGEVLRWDWLLGWTWNWRLSLGSLGGWWMVASLGLGNGKLREFKVLFWEIMLLAAKAIFIYGLVHRMTVHTRESCSCCSAYLCCRKQVQLWGWDNERKRRIFLSWFSLNHWVGLQLSSPTTLVGPVSWDWNQTIYHQNINVSFSIHVMFFWQRRSRRSWLMKWSRLVKKPLIEK